MQSKQILYEVQRPNYNSLDGLLLLWQNSTKLGSLLLTFVLFGKLCNLISIGIPFMLLEVAHIVTQNK